MSGEGTPVASGTATEPMGPPTLFSTATGEGTVGLGGRLEGRGGVEVATAISPAGGAEVLVAEGGGVLAVIAPDGTGGLTGCLLGVGSLVDDGLAETVLGTPDADRALAVVLDALLAGGAGLFAATESGSVLAMVPSDGVCLF